MKKPINKMYVVVRNDLSVAYRCVQGAHALAEYALNSSHSFGKWGNQYLIFLGLPNLICLKSFVKELKKHNIPFSSFKEPDLGNQITAVAFQSCNMNTAIADIVKELPLTY